MAHNGSSARTSNGSTRKQGGAPQLGRPPAAEGEIPKPQESATHLNGESSELLHALLALKDGDFSVRLPRDWTGVAGKIADTFNEIAAANGKIASELNRVGTVVGKQGKTRQRVQFE